MVQGKIPHQRFDILFSLSTVQYECQMADMVQQTLADQVEKCHFWPGTLSPGPAQDFSLGLSTCE